MEVLGGESSEASLADRSKDPGQRWEGGIPPHDKPLDLSAPASIYSNFQATSEDGSPYKAETLV